MFSIAKDELFLEMLVYCRVTSPIPRHCDHLLCERAVKTNVLTTLQCCSCIQYRFMVVRENRIEFAIATFRYTYRNNKQHEPPTKNPHQMHILRVATKQQRHYLRVAFRKKIVVFCHQCYYRRSHWCSAVGLRHCLLHLCSTELTTIKLFRF